MSDTNEVRVGGIWFCKIGEHSPLQRGADSPMRDAVAAEYKKLTGQEPAFIFSGWSGELTEPERAVVENRLPVREATPPADAALAADVLRLIDEQFSHAADVGATYIAFTQEETKRIAAALRARAVPEGFVLVPVEPTDEMVIAALKEVDPLRELIDWSDGHGFMREDARRAYAAMLSASKEVKQ